MSPIKPNEIKPSESIIGKEDASGFRAGPTRSRCSNQIPTITKELKIIIGRGFVFMLRFRRMKKGITKADAKTVHARPFQGAVMVLLIM